MRLSSVLDALDAVLSMCLCVLDALDAVLSMCLLFVSLGSKVRVYMLKSVGESTPSYWRWMDVVFLNAVYAFRPFM